jgi:lambda family phage holin
MDMINWMKEVDSSLWGVFMSIIMAVLRIVRDKEEDKFFRIAVEALLCGAITFTIGSGIKALGYVGWDLFVGGTVGAFGSQYVRALGYAWVKRKAGQKDKAP